MIDILLISPEITKGMKSIGSKCLLQLKKNMTLIEYQILQFEKLKPAKITVNIGFDFEKILTVLQKYVSIDHFINKNYLNTNQGNNLLGYLKKYKPKNLLVFTSGLLIKNNTIIKDYLSNKSKIFILNKPKQNFNIGCSNAKNIEYLFYDMPESWSEIFYLNEDAINVLLEYNDEQFDQMYLFEIINFLLEKNIEFEKVYLDKKNIMKIQCLKDLQTAKLFI